MKYTLKQLKAAFNYVENYLENNNIEEIELSEDWYWHIGTSEKFNFQIVPTTDNKDITVGSLHDDIKILDSFIADEVFGDGNLSRLASILEYIDHHIEEK
jgi:hypothetical protein